MRGFYRLGHKTWLGMRTRWLLAAVLFGRYWEHDRCSGKLHPLLVLWLTEDQMFVVTLVFVARRPFDEELCGQPLWNVQKEKAAVNAITYLVCYQLGSNSLSGDIRSFYQQLW
jgi:hypothetical protein